MVSCRPASLLPAARPRHDGEWYFPGASLSRRSCRVTARPGPPAARAGGLRREARRGAVTPRRVRGQALRGRGCGHSGGRGPGPRAWCWRRYCRTVGAKLRSRSERGFLYAGRSAANFRRWLSDKRTMEVNQLLLFTVSKI